MCFLLIFHCLKLLKYWKKVSKITGWRYLDINIYDSLIEMYVMQSSTIQWSFLHLQRHVTITTFNFKTFHCPQRNPIPINVTFHCLSTFLVLHNHYSTFCLYGLPVLGSSYKYNHIIMWSLVNNFFHFTCFQNPSVL